jgi:peroxiredoxin
MGFAKLRMLLFAIGMIMIAGCNGTGDDLNPSDTDNTPPPQPGTVGIAVGQTAPDFTLSDTLANDVTLSSVVPTTEGVVIYFSMEWCPVCEVHLDNLRASVIPAFPQVRFYVVDYTCSSVAGALNWEQASGYVGGGWTVLADTSQNVLNLYQATMGTTVVIDKAGVIQMNEDYKDGERLREILTSLP